MYKVSVRAMSERKELIEQARRASSDVHPFYEYQNRKVELPVITVEIGVPVYRMANYRTRTAQLKYVHDHGKSEDFFSAGQENESAQQAQHELLIGFAKQGRAASVTPIYQELEREPQREPLVITAAGVVVNGNRRLSAMRELYADRPGPFKHFSHVACAVLPENVTADEIREIEVRLQMRPETKLPYGWVDECLAIRELLDSGRKAENIADLMKKRKKDVERAARALLEAQIYLKEWLRQPGEYQLVEDAQQFFGDLSKGLDGKSDTALEVSRRIAWALLSSPKKLSRRIYDYNFSFDDRTGEVAKVLVDRLNIQEPTVPPTEEDELEVDIPAEDGIDPFQHVLHAFDDPARRDSATDELIAVCDSILERDRQGEVGRRALVAAQAANAKLQEIDLSKADSATFQALQTQLDSILHRAERLKRSLSGMKV